MSDDRKKILEAFDALEAATDSTSAKTLAPADLCKTYRQIIRPKLEFLLPIIELIPVYGKQIAKGIRFLMTLADQVCPA